MTTISKSDIDKMLDFLYNRYTRASYSSHLRCFIGVELSPGAIQDVVSEWHDLSRSTISARSSALRKLINHMAGQGKCDVDLLRTVTFPAGRPPEIRDALSRGETDAVLASAKTVEEKLLVSIMFDTGLRPGFIPEITYADIEEQTFTMRVKRGKYVQVIPTDGMRHWSRKVQFELDAEDDQYIFTAGYKPVSYKTVYRMFKRIASRAGIRATPHSARHTFASQLSEQGVSSSIIRGLMGHSQINTTMRYVHTDIEAMKQAVSDNALSRRLLP